ncbi:MAG TPA: DUF5985 family protein [Burkholderiaceae bacterium]|nr:DUF5985 family protein [Burkholderiaceae bacterium]
MIDMLHGAIAACSLIAALFFLRFWRSSHDRFFLWFALSFLIEAVNRVFIAVDFGIDEAAPVAYMIRLVAYGLILYAIVEKNRRRSFPKT